MVQEWYKKRTNPLKDFLSGMFFGAALYASPRFIPLCGVFVLFPAESLTSLELNLKRLINLLLGCVVFIIGYSAVMGYSLSQLCFNILFTVVLGKVGDGYSGLVTNILCHADGGLREPGGHHGA